MHPFEERTIIDIHDVRLGFQSFDVLGCVLGKTCEFYVVVLQIVVTGIVNVYRPDWRTVLHIRVRKQRFVRKTQRISRVSRIYDTLPEICTVLVEISTARIVLVVHHVLNVHTDIQSFLDLRAEVYLEIISVVVAAIRFELQFLTVVTEISIVFRLFCSSRHRNIVILLWCEFAYNCIIPVCVKIFRVGSFLEQLQFFFQVWFSAFDTSSVHIDVILVECPLERISRTSCDCVSLKSV